MRDAALRWALAWPLQLTFFLALTFALGLSRPALAQPDAADLAVLDMTFSPTPRIGQQTTARVTLRNIGARSTGSFNIQWNYNGAIFNGGHSSLGPGQTSIDNIFFTFTPTGTFTLRYLADSTDVVTELSESNNSIERTVTLVQPQPDLVPGSFSFSGAPREGQTITVSTTVSNIGAAVSPAIPVRWVVNGAEAFRTTMAPLANGDSGSTSFSWTPNFSGNATITFEADAGNTIPESNESNNNRTQSVFVEPRPRPDLAAGSISISGTPRRGETVSVSASVSNIGAAVSPSFPIRWVVNGQEVSRTTFAPLANGESRGTSFSWTPNFSGSATIVFEADAGNTVQESNESNNNTSRTVTVEEQPRPDLSAGAINVSPAPRVGEATTVSASVSNIGAIPSPSIPIRFLADGNVVFSTTLAPLANGQSEGTSFSWTPARPGTQSLRFEVDPSNAIPEERESNNASQINVNVDGPDLTASGISFGTTPTVGQQTTVSATVSNIGGMASPAIPVRWRVGGAVVSSTTVPPLANGASQSTSFQWTPSQPGATSVVLEVDPANGIAETNEGNNATSVQVNVNDIPRADLVSVTIQLSDTPAVGEVVTATAVLRNDGLVASGNFDLRWLVDGAEVARGGHESLLPGQTSSGNVNFSWTPTTEGPHTLRFEADIGDVVDESNETNNGVQIQAQVEPPRVPTLFLDLSTHEMTKNDDGWYKQNPLRARATFRCPTNMAECTGLFRLTVGSGGGTPRFYLYEQGSTSGSDVCSNSVTGTAYSHTALDAPCVNSIGTYRLTAGQIENLDFLLWVQPSEEATLSVSASWGVLGDSENVSIETAAVQPLVFIHGILGSQPPQNKLINNQGDAEAILDPFLGGYTPLLVNLQKTGYVWDKTLFAVAYDWRNSNKRSAGYLAQQMKVLLPRARAEGYVPDDAKADLVVHSMGGMVSRGYVQGLAEDEDGNPIAYGKDVRRLVFLASPHRGFPFDYKTYEGMTWEDYLYDGPVVSGGPLLSFGQDALIWPILSFKHFDPSEDELFNTCLWVPNQTMPALPVPYQVWAPGLRGSTPGVYICDQNALNEFAHHKTRGVLSLLEMLPTDDFAPIYLTNNDGDPADRQARFPFGQDPNDYLNTLNGDIDTLVTLLGIQNVFTIYGTGAPTDLSYEVAPPPAGGMWVHGEAVDDGIFEGPTGDDLVPAWSASLLGLIDLPDDHRVALSAEPPGSDPAGSGRHKAIPRHPAVQKDLVPRWLTGVPVPFSTDYFPPLPSISTILTVMSACPIDLLVEDSMGRRAGYDPSTGEIVKEIPGAIVTVAGVSPHIILVPNAETGGVKVIATGYDQGDFQISVNQLGAGGAVPVALFSGETQAGQMDEFTFDNDPTTQSEPVAVDDAYGMEQGGVLNVAAPGVLDNDIQLEGLPLVAELVDDATPGSLTLNDDGSFELAPPVDFVGTISFTYRAVTGGVASPPATVRIEVRIPNQPPVAGSDEYSAVIDQPLDVPVPGVLANDTDPNDDALTAVLVTPPQGQLALDPSGSFHYQPPAGFLGDDTFTYRASDGFFDSAPATVILHVLPPNRPPLAADDVYRMELSSVLEVPAPGVIANDSDPDGDSLTVRVLGEPSFGVLTLNADGSFRYEPGAGFNGIDEFRYALSDGQAEVEATVFVRPPADCEDLYGLDLETDSVLRLDPITGGVTSSFAIGVDLRNGAMAFEKNSRLWILGEPESEPGILVLLRVDMAQPRVREKYRYSLASDPRPLDPARLGMTLGPDGDALYFLSGSYLSKIDLDDGKLRPVPTDAPLNVDGRSLGLPGRCRDLMVFDELSMGLSRISVRDGSVEPIGPSGLSEPVRSLSGAPDGSLYGLSSDTLYRFDVSTGLASSVVDLGVSLSSIAFRSNYESYLCLDKDYDPRTKLSRYVIKTERVSHVKNCDRDDHEHHEHDACKRHGKKNCSICGHDDDDDDCGKCGDDGFYRIKDGGKMWIRTAALPEDGVYKVRVQFRSPNGKKVRLRGRAGDEKFEWKTDEREWEYSQPVRVLLSAGRNQIRLQASERVDIERIVLERECPGLCEGPKLTPCLDSKLARGGLSRYIVSIEGDAGHSKRDKGCCGSRGDYYVDGGNTSHPGRILAELPIPETGRYLMRFYYRVGTRKQRDESIRVSLGGKSFDFHDSELRNTDKFEWSPKVEVSLTEGKELVEFLSIGRDSVHFERLQLEKVCECGGPVSP